MSEFLKGGFEEFLFRVSDDLTELVVDAKPVPLAVDVGYANCGEFKGGAIELFTLTQSLLKSGAALQDFLNIERAGDFGNSRIEEALMAGNLVESCSEILAHRRLEHVAASARIEGLPGHLRGIMLA